MAESKAALKASRETGFAVRHDDDTTIVRVITDPMHPEYDPRVDLPLDENLVESLIRLGQLQQALGYKDGVEDGKDVVVLVDGRQRWKAMQEVWNRFRENGTDMKFAPSFRICLRGQKSAAQRREIRISSNRHRQELSGLSLAQELRAHLDIVGETKESLDDARVIFNFASLDALKHCLALLDTTPAVQEQLAAGTLSPTGALQLSRQPAEVQDAVAGRIAASAGADGQDDEPEGEDTEGEETTSVSHGDDVEKPAPVEKPAKTKPVSVSEVKEMIRDTTGQTSYAMVSLKQAEKEIDKKEKQREAALKRLEECPVSEYGGLAQQQKAIDAACRLAEINGYLSALRWARGETSIAPVEGASNDKASGAWEALREAIVSAPWPTILRQSDFPALKHAWGKEVTLEERMKIFDEQREHSEKIACSHLLVVAGETVAWREMHGNKTDAIKIDTSSKWFVRLMDPFGNPSQLVRDFGAHGWLGNGSKIAGLQVWKTSFAPLSKSKTVICIGDDQVAKWIPGTCLEVVESIEKVVARIIADRWIDHSVSDVTRALRFGAPWHDEEAMGPDLNEGSSERDAIRDEIEEDLGINIPDEDCTWSTVGDLIDYVEARVKQVSEAGGVASAVEDAGADGDSDVGELRDYQ